MASDNREGQVTLQATRRGAGWFVRGGVRGSAVPSTYGKVRTERGPALLIAASKWSQAGAAACLAAGQQQAGGAGAQLRSLMHPSCLQGRGCLAGTGIGFPWRTERGETILNFSKNSSYWKWVTACQQQWRGARKEATHLVGPYGLLSPIGNDEG